MICSHLRFLPALDRDGQVQEPHQPQPELQGAQERHPAPDSGDQDLHQGRKLLPSFLPNPFPNPQAGRVTLRSIQRSRVRIVSPRWRRTLGMDGIIGQAVGVKTAARSLDGCWNRTAGETDKEKVWCRQGREDR